MLLRGVGQRQFDEDLTVLGEFDRIADQVNQHLPQPGRVAGQTVRHLLGDEIDEFNALAGAALAEQVGDFGDQLARIELDHCQIETTGFDLRQIENVVDDPEQRLARPDEVLDELRLPLVERCRREQVGGAEDPVHWRAYLVAHRRQELRFGAVGSLLALHHLPDVVLHDRHRAQQDAGLILAADRDRRLQLTAGDAVRDRSRRRERPDDAACQEERNRGGEQHDEQRPGDADVPE